MKFIHLFSAVVGLIVSSSAMGQSAKIELKWQEGKTYHTKQTVKMGMDMASAVTDTSMEITSAGKAAAHKKGTGVSSSVKRVKMHIIGGGQEMTYDSSKKEGNDARLAVEMDKLLKMQFTAVYDKAGKFLEVEGIPKEQQNLPGMSKKELESNITQQVALLPNREVKVGDTWLSKVTSPLPGMNKELHITYDVNLDEIVVENGRKIAKMSFTGKMADTKVTQQGIDMMIKATDLSGTIHFDVELGQLRKSAMNMNLTVTPDGAAGKVIMKMKVGSELLKVE